MLSLLYILIVHRVLALLHNLYTPYVQNYPQNQIDNLGSRRKIIVVTFLENSSLNFIASNVLIVAWCYEHRTHRTKFLQQMGLISETKGNELKTKPRVFTRRFCLLC